MKERKISKDISANEDGEGVNKLIYKENLKNEGKRSKNGCPQSALL
jgi:hypothetical protein